MAEYFAFEIAESLLGKLTSSLYEEAYRAYHLYEDLQGIKDTLSIVKGVLLDAEEKRDQKHGLREWLSQIRNLCFDAEDILDAFGCQNLRKQIVKASGNTRMKVGHFFSSSNPLLFRLRMARQIKYIRHKLDKIAADGNKFGLQRIHVDHKLLPRREMTYSHVDASGVIGRENDREEIIKFLMQPHPHGDGHGDKSLCVIPIVGIGGLGKTTLAKLVFNDKRMDELFQLKMWVCVSDNFDIRQIITKLINSASAYGSASAIAHHENINNLDIELMQCRLRYKLSGQKFLLVLDDVWNDDRAKWIELKDLINGGAVGSKIIVTTRSNSIASMMGTVPSYVLEGLSMENCLSLFVKWAFKEGEEKKYPNLVEIGKEIIKKCRGVPLAVRTLGSSLFLNFDVERWEFVKDNEIWNLKQKREDILPALKLSYDQMPSYLRQCFASFSLFPKDFGFTGVHVSCLWEASGLLGSPVGRQKVNNIARLYIDELRSRSFVDDFEDFGHLYCFKVHDLIHDLALYIAKEEFVVVNSHTCNIPEQARHFSVVENFSLNYSLFPKSTSVRTILFPIDGIGFRDEALLNTWIIRYRYLRYLDLGDSSLETLPNSITKLEHLRVLNLTNNCKLKRLPHSICKLQNLQFLSLRGCVELETLPKGLGMLISLQLLSITTKQSILPEDEFTRLINLRVLSFEYCDNLKFLFREAQFTSLEVLVVQSCRILESLPLHILPKLEVLSVIRCEMLNLSFKCECSIRNLRMKFLHLEHCPRQQTLPQWIQGAANTLQILFILDFDNLKMLPEWLTTMSHLKTLRIVNCPQLFYLQSDMHHLTHIKCLAIGETREGKLLFQMEKQFRLRLRD